VADRFHDLQLDHALGQEPQRPTPITRRRGPQPQRDDLRFRFVIEFGFGRWPLACLAVQDDLEALGDKPLANPLHRLHATAERLADLRVRPGRSVRIRLQQSPSPLRLLRAPLQLAHDFVTRPTLRIGQPHNRLLDHTNLLVDRRFVETGQATQPQYLGLTGP
jgi:hypothetical protein